MDEIKALLEKAENRLEVSRSLFENGYYGDAVRRAYYCMFFAAKALLLAKNISAKTHRGLIRKFGLEFVNRNLIEECYGRASGRGGLFDISQDFRGGGKISDR